MQHYFYYTLKFPQILMCALVSYQYQLLGTFLLISGQIYLIFSSYSYQPCKETDKKKKKFPSVCVSCPALIVQIMCSGTYGMLTKLVTINNVGKPMMKLTLAFVCFLHEKTFLFFVLDHFVYVGTNAKMTVIIIMKSNLNW